MHCHWLPGFAAAACEPGRVHLDGAAASAAIPAKLWLRARPEAKCRRLRAPPHLLPLQRSAQRRGNQLRRRGRYDADRIRQLKDSAKALYVSGSGTLVRALIRDGLVDDLHLFMYPVTRAGGPRLFEDGVGPAKWARPGGRLYDNGVVYLHLTPA